MMAIALRAGLAALVLSLLTVAQPPPAEPASGRQQAPEPQDQIFRIQTPAYETFDLEEGLYAMIGDVAIRVRGMELRCDSLLAWVALPGDGSQEADGVGRYVKEIYAEGNFELKQGARRVQAARIFLDLQNDRAIALDASTSYRLRRGGDRTRLVIRAEEMRLLSQEKLVALGAQLFQSPFTIPTWYLQADRLTLEAAPLASRVAGRDVYAYRAEGAALRTGDTTLLPLPDLGGDNSGESATRYIDDIIFGSTSRFGIRIEPVIGDDIVIDKKRWGRWRARGAWLSARGFGFGTELDYATEEYQGSFLGRWQDDEGRDRAFGRPPDQTRGRASWWHRHQLPNDVQLDLEFNLFSDRGFFPVYYEREFENVKAPENLVFAKKRWFNSQISGLLQARLNDWLPTTESLPDVRYDLVTEPVFDLGRHRAYLDTTLRVGRVTRRIDPVSGPIGDRSGRSWRADLDTLLEVPLDLEPFTVTPFAGVRTTYYSRDLGDEERIRLGAVSGFSIASQAWKSFETEGGLFELDGLRHVIYPVLTVRNISGRDFDPVRLPRYDETELVDDGTVVELQLRNLLQTRRQRDGGFELDTFFDLDLRQRWFPDDSDNFGEAFGNLDADLLIRFTPELQLHTDLEFNWYGRGLEVFNLSVGYQFRDELQIATGFRHFDETYDVVFAQIWWRIEPKYLVVAETAWDFNDGEGVEHRLRLNRIGAEWVWGITLQADVQEGDYGFALVLQPRLLFNPRAFGRAFGADPSLRFPRGSLTR